jgi:general secretion pathway protein L
VAAQLIVRPSSARQYQWALADAGIISDIQTGGLDSLAEFVAPYGRLPATYLVSGFDVLFRSVPFTEKERKHLTKTIPYTLEDELLGDVDDLHMVLGKPGEGRVYVAAIDEGQFAGDLDALQDAGVFPTLALPEQAVLLSSVVAESSGWLLYQYNDRLILRVDSDTIYCLEPSMVPSVCAIVTDEFAELPPSIEAYYEDEQQWQEALIHIPESLQHLITAQKKAPFSLIVDTTKAATGFNFLQGAFAQSQEWSKVWKQWQSLAIFAALTLVLHLGLMFVENRGLQAENDRLLAEIEQIHREVLPRGKIVDSRKQLQNELNRLQGGGEAGLGLLEILMGAGKAVSAAEGLDINSMNFDANNGELRFDVVVNNFQEVEKIKSGIEANGLTYELLNSNAQGDKLRARIRIKQDASNG